MKILNLYAGIGGNRKDWGDSHDITAVEYKPEIVAIYHDFFPKDKIVVADAHQYLLEHYKEFDFIWSSPPCPTHSQLGRLRVLSDSKITGAYKSVAKYPDMKLYEEIILLKHFFKGLWCVENVIAYYEPLIRPQTLGRHHFWTNFFIPHFPLEADNIDKGLVKEWEQKYGYNLSKYNGIEKRLVLRNCVVPELGKHILDWSQKELHKQLFV